MQMNGSLGVEKSVMALSCSCCGVVRKTSCIPRGYVSMTRFDPMACSVHDLGVLGARWCCRILLLSYVPCMLQRVMHMRGHCVTCIQWRFTDLE